MVRWILLWQQYRIYIMWIFIAEFTSSPEVIGMAFMMLYLDLIGEVFSGVQPWFRILIWKSVELWSDLFPWLPWGEEEEARLALMVIVGVRLSWSSVLIIVGAGTVLLWTRIYSAKKTRGYSANCRLMLGGVSFKVMCLVRSQMFLPFVLLKVRLFQIRRGRLSC